MQATRLTALAALTLAPVAAADLPTVLDRIPAGTSVYAVSPNLRQMLRDTRELTVALAPEAGIDPEIAGDAVSVLQLLLLQDGIDRAGPVAILPGPADAGGFQAPGAPLPPGFINVEEPQPGQARPVAFTQPTGQPAGQPGFEQDAAFAGQPFGGAFGGGGFGGPAGMLGMLAMASESLPVVLLPIEDFELFAESPVMESSATEIEPGIYEVALDLGGQFTAPPIYIREAGDVAVLGFSQFAVEEIDIDPGHMPDQRRVLSDAGELAINSNGLTVIVNPGYLEEIGAGAALGDGARMIGGFAAFLGPQLGGIAGEAVGLLLVAADGFLADGTAGTISLSVEDGLLTLDIGANFEDGSEIAGFFEDAGSSAKLIENLPAGPYLFAYGLDLASPGLGEIKNRIPQYAPAFGGITQAIAAPIDAVGVTGVSQVVGANPQIGEHGLLSGGVTALRTTNPEAARGVAQMLVESVDGVSVGPMEYTAEFDPAVITLGGVEVDRYAVESSFFNDAGGLPIDIQFGPAIIQEMLVGAAGGPSGLVAATDDTLFITSGPNAPMLEAAIEASKGGLNLLDDPSVRDAGLPENRFFELYISSGEFLSGLAPLAQMLTGEPIESRMGEAPRPVAISATASGGGVLLRVRMPLEAAIDAGQGIVKQQRRFRP